MQLVGYRFGPVLNKMVERCLHIRDLVRRRSKQLVEVSLQVLGLLYILYV